MITFARLVSRSAEIFQAISCLEFSPDAAYCTCVSTEGLSGSLSVCKSRMSVSSTSCLLDP